ncbi:MAG TPA: hypothetical protein VFL66_11570 [Gaiellaceae bacterium]|nr:hypothetical protein [Gaiellaceae bacterium]
MSRAVRLALGAAAVAAGAGCILLGRAVLGEGASVERADAALSAPVASAPVARSGGISGFLLSTGDDRAARAAAADYTQARTQTTLALAVRSRALAEDELAPLALSGPAGRRSWAQTLLASIELDQSRLDPRNAKQHVKASIAALAAAVGADPGNEDAKRDLELLLTLQSKGKSRGQKEHRQQASHPKGSRGHRHGRMQAVATPAGSGW